MEANNSSQQRGVRQGTDLRKCNTQANGEADAAEVY